MKWEYLVQPLSKVTADTAMIERYLNRRAKEDWELITVDNGIAYFKRPIIEKEPSYFTPEYFDKLNSGNEIPTKK